MRKRLVTLAMSLVAVAVLFPAGPASATTCYVEDPGVDDVQCMLYGTPIAHPVCNKTDVC